MLQRVGDEEKIKRIQSKENHKNNDDEEDENGIDACENAKLNNII